MRSFERSWVPVPSGSGFPLQNLPYGVFVNGGRSGVGVAIGASIFDLRAACDAGIFDRSLAPLLQEPDLRALFAAGRTAWRAVRERLTELLREGTRALDGIDRERLLLSQREVRMQLPVRITDYVDFYSSIEHATNLGKLFRPNAEPLLPNWRWLPVGYHGRAGTVVVDGTPIVRPCGQRKAPDAQAPDFGPSARLDIELEVGFFTGPANAMGSRISTGSARDHIFGLVLVNDWSARDIQAWEYQPLGPFLGKSFATSISPWVVTIDALEPYRVTGPLQEPPPLDYLACDADWNFDVELSVELQTQSMRDRGIAPAIVSRSNFRSMYWSMAQQLAHATVNGATVQPGDLFASGTISGPTPESAGSLIELTWNAQRPIQLPDGSTRAFLEDGDTVTLRGRCERPGKPHIGFGSVSGTILPASP